MGSRSLWFKHAASCRYCRMLQTYIWMPIYQECAVCICVSKNDCISETYLFIAEHVYPHGIQDLSHGRQNVVCLPLNSMERYAQGYHSRGCFYHKLKSHALLLTFCGRGTWSPFWVLSSGVSSMASYVATRGFTGQARVSLVAAGGMLQGLVTSWLQARMPCSVCR